MITNFIMAALISAAGATSTLVYNIQKENNRMTQTEVFTLEDGKYLKRAYKMYFGYNAQGQVTDKKTYVWNEARKDYVLRQTEHFNPTDGTEAAR